MPHLKQPHFDPVPQQQPGGAPAPCHNDLLAHRLLGVGVARTLAHHRVLAVGRAAAPATEEGWCQAKKRFKVYQTAGRLGLTAPRCCVPQRLPFSPTTRRRRPNQPLHGSAALTPAPGSAPDAGCSGLSGRVHGHGDLTPEAVLGWGCQDSSFQCVGKRNRLGGSGVAGFMGAGISRVAAGVTSTWGRAQGAALLALAVESLGTSVRTRGSTSLQLVQLQVQKQDNAAQSSAAVSIS